MDGIEFVLLWYSKLVSENPELKSNKQFAIISSNSAQVNILKERYKIMFGLEPEKVVDITTVDGCHVKLYIPSRMKKNGKINLLIIIKYLFFSHLFLYDSRPSHSHSNSSLRFDVNLL